LREVAFLKKLKPARFWRGDLVHSTIAEVLKSISWRNRTPYTLGQALRLARTWARDQWRDSERRARERDPKPAADPNGPILFEHYFQDTGDNLELDTVQQEVEDAVRRFHAWFRKSALRDTIPKADRVWIDPMTPPVFPVGDVDFLTKVDLAVRLEDQFVIYDWKTAKPPTENLEYRPERQQLQAYAMWPHLTLRVPVEQIAVSVLYLGGTEQTEATIQIRPQEVQDIMWDLQLCVEAGIDVLQRKEDYTLRDFDYASSIRTCRSCAFQELCQRFLKNPEEAAL